MSRHQADLLDEAGSFAAADLHHIRWNVRPTSGRIALLLALWVTALPMLLSAGPVAAANLHLCDCADGAEPACSPGDDANPGTAAQPWRSHAQARAAFASLAPGDELRFCRGGAWSVDEVGERWVNPDCTPMAPCVVGAYTPAWASAQSARPLLRRTDGRHGISLADGGNAEPEQGYVFEDLQLQSSTGSGSGFFIQNDVDDVVIRNVRIVGFDIGVYVAGSNACAPSTGCDGHNERIRLEHSELVDNRFVGWLGASNDSVIAHSVFERNGREPVFDHNIYLSDTADGAVSGMRVIGNRLFGSALDEDGVCRGVSLVVHGLHDDLIIEGNDVREDIGRAAGGCWGIAVDPGYGSRPEAFSNVVIRGNVVRNVGNVAIGVASCRDCLIENNVIIQEQPASSFSSVGIAAPNRARQANDQAMDGIRIRNNSMWFGPDSAGTAIRLRGEGTGHTLVSNAVEHAGVQPLLCLDIDTSEADYAAIDHNQCHGTMTSPRWTQAFNQLDAWQTFSGFDLNSNLAAPGFANASTGDLSASGPEAGMVDSGHPTLSSERDHSGLPRTGAPDRGAFEWSASVLFRSGFETQP